jgi:hypothetical protein
MAAPLMNEADCLARQHRRTGGASNYPDLTLSAYRASGLVPRLDAVDRFLQLSVRKRRNQLVDFASCVRQLS